MVPEKDLDAMKAVLEVVDGKAVGLVVDLLAEAALAMLDVPGEKIAQADAIITRDIKVRGQLLDKYISQEKAGLMKFTAENETMVDGTLEELKGLLSPEDLVKLEAWFDETTRKASSAFSGK